MPEDKRVVEKSVENAEFATQLYNMYPNAKFVHIIRIWYLLEDLKIKVAIHFLIR